MITYEQSRPSKPVSGSVTIAGAAAAVDLGSDAVVTWLGGPPTGLRGFAVRVLTGTVRWGPSGVDATHGNVATAGAASEVFGDSTGSSLSGWYVYSAAGATLEVSGLQGGL